MNTLVSSIPNEISFKDFLFRSRRNRIILCLSAAAIIIQFCMFKYFYPFASYIHGDSFSYINAADKNLTINTYMVGYSKFLRLFSVFAKPDIVLVAFQYLLIQCSALFLLFTIYYFHNVGKKIQTVLICFMVLNPLFLHLANLISSDGFFLALSLTWFALLLWIIYLPSNKVLFWHAVILFIAFTVRYNAMIYPFISALAFGLSRLPRNKKILAFSLSLVSIGWFMGMTMYQYKKLTGYWQYSPFAGWQMANNAMYAYRYVYDDERKPVPEKYKALNKMICDFYDRTRDLTMNPSEKAMASTFYMWSSGMPLMQYRDSLYKVKDTSAKELKKWSSMGPLYKEYGLYIIRQYPLHYLAFYVWPNTRKYYAPPVEFLSNYNSGSDSVTSQTKRWFGYKSTSVYIRMESKITWILDFYPILTGVINLVMFFGLLYYILLKGWRQNLVFNKIIIMGATIWLLNAFFTIFASSAALRFQSFPIILTTTFAVLLIDWMAELMRAAKESENNSQSKASNQAIA